MPFDAHLVLTDSGLGGLSICAAIERRCREAAGAARIRLTYVNAWPSEGQGYNDLPDMAARAAVFDRALARMTDLHPDRILIACNTLSIVYPHTTFSRAPAVPVDGIVEAGLDVFAEALAADPASALVLLGTKTTISSGVHRDGLIARGVDPDRIAGVHCHGLAGAIERDPDSRAVTELVDACAGRARDAAPAGPRLLAGLCCTHYGYVSARLCAAIARALGRPVQPLDPNVRMVRDLPFDGLFAAAASGADGSVEVSVLSKVVLDETSRSGVARLIAPVSPATARALLSYSRVPDLF